MAQKHTIGGQALIEGVMMRGKTSLALSVRTPSGMIATQTHRNPPPSGAHKIPIIRGIVSFFSMMVLGIRMIFASEEISSSEPNEEGKREELGQWAVLIIVLLSLGLTVGIFIMLPALLTDLLYFVFGLRGAVLRSVLEATFRLTIFVGYLWLISLLKDVKRMFGYHGAEHKTVNCYERGLELNVDNVLSCSKHHRRCGTTFLFLAILISIVFYSILNVFLAGTIFDHFLARTALRLLLLPLVAGVSFEVLMLLSKAPDNWFFDALRAPGLALQRLTTFEPDREMVEVALEAFKTTLMLENDPLMPTIEFGQCYFVPYWNSVAQRMAGVGDGSELDWILCDVFGKKRGELAGRVIIVANLAAVKRIDQIVAERLSGKPLDYVLGKTAFFGRDYIVDENVLIPRMETERLVELVLGECKKGYRVLDLCAGSGCIADAVFRGANAASGADVGESGEPDVVVVGADVSQAALDVASKNVHGKVRLVQSDLFEALEGEKFNIIVSNPPYVASAVVDTLASEVRAQPRLALDGGEDGLDFYRKIIAQAPRFLTMYGKLFLEIGFDQADAVRRLLLDNFINIRIEQDYEGHDRYVIAEVNH